MKTKRFAIATAQVAAVIGLAGAFHAPPAEASCDGGVDPSLGEICVFGFNFCPRGFADADGRILPIVNNQSLYSLYGSTFGGDGRTSFGLPDLRGRTTVHAGSGMTLGGTGGAETTVLLTANMPSHTHSAVAASLTVRAFSGAGNATTPAGNVPASRARANVYSTNPADVAMGASAITASVSVSSAGAGLGFSVRDPYLVLQHCVATVGLFPSQP
jgi:microcystin-dependent protein